MKLKFLFIFLLCSWAVNAQTNFTFTRIPYSATDLKRPNAGMEYWIYQNQVTVPLASSPQNNETGRYDRWEWRAFEQTQGVYNWALFDASINEAINRGQKFSFGIMASCGGCSDFAVTVSGNTNKTLPNYVINNGGAFVYGGVWYPNWNSTVYKSAWQAFQNALAAHINTTSYNGVPYSRVINYIDLRGVGEYDEWHFCGYCPDYPSSLMYVADNGGYKPTVASYKELIDIFTTAYANYRLVAMSDGFDPGGWSETPDEVINYLITRTTNKGNVGWRRDNWGHNRPTWYENKFESNPSTWLGQAAVDIIMERWKTAPVVGEPYQGESQVNGQSRPYQILTESVNGAPAQTQFYHLSNLGNGNMERTGETGTQTSVREAHKRMGYRYYLSAGSMTTNVTSGGSFNVSLTWGNEGVAPTYDRWYIRYTLRNSTTNAIVWTGNSTYNLKNLLPDSTKVDSQNFTATGVPVGTYRLHVSVVDSSGYMPNMPLFINGVQSDVSYILRSNINVTSTGNQPPVSNAGVDQNITLPTNEVFLNGSASDVDGTVSTYAWSKVSGPSVFNIVSPNLASTYVNNLVAGTYVFRLTVTDNLGATATDDVTIQVNATAPANIPPVANAGANQTIQLPTNSVTVVGSGTDSDGTISSYAWTKISGTGGSITTPSASSTGITGLSQGTYVFRLTVTDNLGATGFDDVQITVSAANVSPTANAGADQTIELPTNTATLSGSGTDSDGSISAYLWTKVSGPAGGNITSSTSASTGITGLIQGTYVYRLRVTDNQAATATDEITITVNPAPPPSAPGNWVFSVNPTPATGSDGQGVSLGMKFRSSQAGAITQVRFWKTGANTGTHTAAIYTEDGTRLWKGTFTGETASGWQYVNTDTVFISANQTYIVAYYSPTGNYAKTEGSFFNSVINNMLTAPSTYTSNGNGVYLYSDSVSFPVNTYQGNNYWIDVNYQNIEAPVTPNIGPVVSAGLDKIIKLPATSTQLQGTATDSDGTIASVDWAQLSGPVTATISDTTILNPVISGLTTIGTYQFLITVTDDDGATSTDLIAISVFGASSNYRSPRTYMYNGRKIYFRR